MAALILLTLGLTEKPRALQANNLSVPVEVSVHSALGRGVMGVREGGLKGKVLQNMALQSMNKGGKF